MGREFAYGSEMDCREAQPLVGAYLDGELGEAHAAGLRKHLLGCIACRNGAQDVRTLRRWIAPLRGAAEEGAPEFAVAVPPGFASRVARRAFAGDPGERPGVEIGAPDVGATANGSLGSEGAGDGRLLRFVVRLTALAAAAAIVVAIAYRAQVRPTGDRLSADDRTPLTVQEIRDRLDRLNQGLEQGQADESERAVEDPSERGAARGSHSGAARRGD